MRSDTLVEILGGRGGGGKGREGGGGVTLAHTRVWDDKMRSIRLAAVSPLYFNSTIDRA